MKVSAAVLALSILLILALVRVRDRFFSEGVEILFFDVGQGDAILVRLPRGKNWLIDGGGGWGDQDQGSRELFPELARLGILHLDSALMSHPDQDHALGLTGVFRQLDVSAFWFNDFFRRRPTPLFERLLDLAHDRNIRRVAVGETRIWGERGATLTVRPAAGASGTNDRSLVVTLNFGGCSAFFAGDIEAGAERELLRTGMSRVSLLKVAHHGSRTSTTREFLQRLAPRWAVISVGARNLYGHPHPTVLARLSARHVQVFRTDFHGYVRFRFTPDGMAHCETALGSCGDSMCSKLD